MEVVVNYLLLGMGIGMVFGVISGVLLKAYLVEKEKNTP